MVGGLVQQHQVGRAHQRARQLQAHAPAAGEAVDRRVELLDLESPGPAAAPARARGRRRRRLRPARMVRVGHRVAVVGGFGRGERGLRAPSAACRLAARSRWRRRRSRASSCATSPMRQRGGMSTSPASACSRSVSSANRLDLPAPLRPTRPTFSPGLQRDAGASSTTLVPRRRVMLRSVIMRAPAAPRVTQQHLVVAGAGVQPGGLQAAERRLRSAPRSWPISSTSTPCGSGGRGIAAACGARSPCRRRRRPAPAPARRGTRRGSAFIEFVVDVGRVAQDQVVAARGGGQAVALQQRMRSPRPCRSTLMRATASASADRSVASTCASGQAIAASTARLPLPVHRSSTRRGRLGQPGVERAVGQQLGDQRARHDDAFVDVEGHALQPGLAGQVGGRLAGGDALLDQRLDGGVLRRPTASASATPSSVVQRQAQLPQHQPRGFVEGVGRCHGQKKRPPLRRAAAALDMAVDQGHASATAHGAASLLGHPRRRRVLVRSSGAHVERDLGEGGGSSCSSFLARDARHRRHVVLQPPHQVGRRVGVGQAFVARDHACR